MKTVTPGRKVHAEGTGSISGIVGEASDHDLRIGAARVFHRRGEVHESAGSFPHRLAVGTVNRHAIHEDRAEVAVLRWPLCCDVGREAWWQHRCER